MVKPISVRSKNFVRKPKRKKRIIGRVLFYFTLVIFLGAIVYVLFFSPLMLITHIQISGNQDIATQLLLDQAKAQISGKYLRLFNKDNFLLVNDKKIKENLMAKFPQIRNAEVKKKFPARLEISITERIPTMIICSNGQCYILDENGQAYDKANAPANQALQKKLAVLTDQNNRSINLGDTVLAPSYMDYVAKIKQEVEDETDLKLNDNFQTPSLVSDDIQAKTQGGWEIYFNEQIGLDTEVQALKAVLGSEITQAQRADLEYVDLRISDKVYYKFRAGTPEDEAQQKIAAQNAAAAKAAAASVPAATPTSTNNNADNKNK